MVMKSSRRVKSVKKQRNVKKSRVSRKTSKSKVSKRKNGKTNRRKKRTKTKKKKHIMKGGKHLVNYGSIITEILETDMSRSLTKDYKKSTHSKYIEDVGTKKLLFLIDKDVKTLLPIIKINNVALISDNGTDFIIYNFIKKVFKIIFDVTPSYKEKRWKLTLIDSIKDTRPYYIQLKKKTETEYEFMFSKQPIENNDADIKYTILIDNKDINSFIGNPSLASALNFDIYK